MAKYKCPKCGTIYHEIPRFCATCGVEFLPPEEQDQPKEAAPVVAEPTPVVAPVEQPAPAPQEEKPVEQPAPVPQEEKPVEQPILETSNAESSELNITSEKEKIPGRVIAAFILALVTIVCYVTLNIFPYLRSMQPAPRVYIILGLSAASMVLSICTLAIGGRPGQYKKGHGMAVFARVIGIIFLILSIIDTIAWGTVTIMYINSVRLESALGFSFKETIDRYFTTGVLKIVKLK